MAFQVLVFLLMLHNVYCADNKDLITSLPGISELPKFKQYSGYLDVSAEKHLHYWFVESQHSPSSDPVVLWLNGGPGCSSLDGLLSENGPLHVKDDGQTLYMNPYSWNKIANVLYLESPAGVGYSYDDKKHVETSDDEVATYNYKALLSFFKKFPEYSSNPFYITGESYGGIYIPTLSVKILESGGSINFLGFAVGNGLSSYALNDDSLVYFAYYHGLIGEVLWKGLISQCCDGGSTRENCSFSNPKTSSCSDYVEEVDQIVYNSGLNSYALYLDCAGAAEKSYQFSMRNVFRNLDTKFRKRLLSQKPRGQQTSMLGDTPPCINSTAITTWLNLPKVREALHIPSTLPKWEICSDAVERGYVRNYTNMTAQYNKLTQNPNLRILIYNGDTDMACNFLGDQWFADSLGLKPVKSHAPWYVNGQVAGFAREYDHFVYTTIRGAGHMVPQWAPAYAYAMFEKFLTNTPFANTNVDLK